MKHNPKVVPFERSAAYVRHRALKNLRGNKLVDALELMRHAVEHSPDNREYLLDLAGMYCELGQHEQSNRILLDMLAGEDAPAECYYGLALNEFGRNELESARRALTMYDCFSRDGEYTEDAGNLRAELDYFDALRRPGDRRLGRAWHIAVRACEAMKLQENGRACRLFRRSLKLCPDQEEMRALYALALRLDGDEPGALSEARRAVASAETGVRTLCIASQVCWLCGDSTQACRLARRAAELRPDGMDLKLLIFMLAEFGMNREAAESARLGLQEAPLDRMLLHQRAVTLHRAGVPDALVAGYWLRILRVDPEDSVARFYHDAAVRGELSGLDCELSYEVPAVESKRRMVCILESLNQGLDAAVERWHNDREYRGILRWAACSGEENCGRAAVMIIACACDDEAESTLRELFYRGDVPLSVKRHALICLQLRGAHLGRILPPGMNLKEDMLCEPARLLEAMPVAERQLVRLCADELELCYGISALNALTVLWHEYRLRSGEGIDPLVSTQEAAAALAWVCLANNGHKPSVSELCARFMCSPRRLAYYVRHMQRVLQLSGAEV